MAPVFENLQTLNNNKENILYVINKPVSCGHLCFPSR